MGWLEDHALFSREGTAGVRQVNVTGLVAAAFTHRDSRAGDPDLHTHVAVANKVQTLQGRWLSIDGRILHAAATAVSRPTTPPWKPASPTSSGCGSPSGRAGTDQGRSARSKASTPHCSPAGRHADGRSRSGRRACRAFTAEHGRAPSRVEQIQLAQQATLETRDPKHEPRSLASNAPPGTPKRSRSWAGQASRRHDHPCAPAGDCLGAGGDAGLDRAGGGAGDLGAGAAPGDLAALARLGRNPTPTPRRKPVPRPPTPCRCTGRRGLAGPVATAHHRRGLGRAVGGAPTSRQGVGAHRRRDRAVHLTTILAAKQYLLDVAHRTGGTRSTPSRSPSASWKPPPTATTWTRDRPRWSKHSPPTAGGSSWSSPGPAPERPPPSKFGRHLDRRRRPHPRPRPLRYRRPPIAAATGMPADTLAQFTGNSTMDGPSRMGR